MSCDCHLPNVTLDGDTVPLVMKGVHRHNIVDGPAERARFTPKYVHILYKNVHIVKFLFWVQTNETTVVLDKTTEYMD